MTTLYAGTDRGLWTFDYRDNELEHLATTLAGHAVRDVAPSPDAAACAYVACGYGGRGLHRVVGRGRESTELGLGDRWVWGVAVAPDGSLFVGTEPPGVYRSTDGGMSFDPAPDIPRLAADSDWFFWHEPYEAGHVHGFGIHPDVPHRVLAGVEVGGAVRSCDAGDSWEKIGGLEGFDVHNIAPDPVDPERWYAATGEGLMRSGDGGDAWRPVDPLADHYVAKVDFDAANRPCVTAAPDSSADTGSFWKRTDTWRKLHTSPADSLSGMIATHPTDADVVVHTTSTPARCHLLVSGDGGETWTRKGPALPRVRTMALA